METLAMLIVIIVSIGLSDRLNKKLLRQNPAIKPFQWGYFLGVQGLIGGPLLAIFGLIAVRSEFELGLFLVIYSIVGFLPSFFVIKRKRWALITLTILGLNPFIWIANIFYIKNRWNDLV